MTPPPSTTKSLQQASHSTLPGTIMMALAGLAVHDMEPTALRYFDIEQDGTLRYLKNEELDSRADLDVALASEAGRESGRDLRGFAQAGVTLFVADDAAATDA